jgi:hypothetical protein
MECLKHYAKPKKDLIKMQKVLDENLTVLAKIYEMNIVKKEPIWFSKLVELFDGKLSRVQISKALDRLFDLCFIKGDWQKVDERWTRTFAISSCSEYFAREMYEKSMVPR